MTNQITYRQVGDYLIPNLQAPESPKVGKYGMLRHTFLREHKSAKFTKLFMTGKLNEHLEQVDKEANEMMTLLITKMSEAQQVTEKLKAENQMLWVQRMNNIRSAAEEIVLKELIYR
ncbi:MAG: TnpV protein [Clostridia bacterium]|nr:TnpV protein [Clostridia bacterium]